MSLRFGLAAVAGTLWLGGCGACADEEVGRHCRPGGRPCAVVSVRDCGATTGFSTHVTMEGGGPLAAWRAETVLIVDDNHGRVAAGDQHSVPLKVEWKHDGSLRLVYAAGARVFRAESSAGGVGITTEAEQGVR